MGNCLLGFPEPLLLEYDIFFNDRHVFNLVYYSHSIFHIRLPWCLVGKESACSAGDSSSIPGSERSPGEGHGTPLPLQCSCLENPTDGGAWGATVHGVAKEPDTTWWVNNSSSNPPHWHVQTLLIDVQRKIKSLCWQFTLCEATEGKRKLSQPRNVNSFFIFFFFFKCCLTLHVVTDAKDMSWFKNLVHFSP